MDSGQNVILKWLSGPASLLNWHLNENLKEMTFGEEHARQMDTVVNTVDERVTGVLKSNEEASVHGADRDRERTGKDRHGK